MEATYFLLGVHELENVRQHFRHGAIQMRRDLLADVSRFVQRLRQRLIFDNRYVVFGCDLANSQRQIVLAFGQHPRRRHALHLVADRHGVVRRVDDYGRGFGNFLHHVAARQVALDAPHAVP